MFSDWKAIVSSIAPAIGTALGGPFGGMAAKFALDKLGIVPEEGNEVDQLKSVIDKGDHETLLKIKEADNSFKENMRALDIDVMKIDAGDRDSARKREIATKDKTPTVLAAAIVIGFFGVLLTVAFNNIPQTAMTAVNIMLGALTAALSAVVSYYYGTNRSSSEKTSHIVDLVKKGK